MPLDSLLHNQMLQRAMVGVCLQALSFSMAAGMWSLPILLLTLPALLASVAAYHILNTLAASALDLLLHGVLGSMSPTE